jgi:hypothetical protein
MSKGLTRLRLVFAIAVLASYEGLWGGSHVSALDRCDAICTLAADCAAECMNIPSDPELPGFQSTCGDYNGGACSNTCNTTCTPYGSSGTSCDANGGSATTCGSYGVYLTCGDGVCAAGTGDEDCNSCSADCGSCHTPTQYDYDNSGAMESDAESDTSGLSGVDYALAMADDGIDWGWAGDTGYYDWRTSGALTCDQKTSMLAAADALLKDLSLIANIWNNLWVYSMGTATQNAINSVQADRDAVAQTQCLLF